MHERRRAGAARESATMSAHDEQDIARWVDSVRTQGYVIIE